MKILKYIFFLLLISFIASSIYVATKDDTYHVEESRILEAPAPLLFEQINNYESWSIWSWVGSQEFDVILGDTVQGEGARLRWENGEINDGSLITTKSEPFARIDQKLVFDAGIAQSRGNMYWILEPVAEGTRVSLGLEGSQDFREKLAYTLRNDEIGEIFAPKFREALEALEHSTKTRMEEFSVNVNGITEHGGGFYMYSSTATRLSEVQHRGAEMLQQVSQYMDKNDISISGKPFLIYNERDKDNASAIFSAAIPTPSRVITPSGSQVLTGYLPAQKVLKTTLKGNHKNAQLAWDEAYKYIEENELTPKPGGETFEIFITDPVAEINPARWVTEIYIPIE